MPHDLVADARLKPLDIRLVAILLRYARAKATCWPSVVTLADDLGRCVRTVQYALKRLADAGWITSRPDANPTGRVLVLTWREPRCTPPVQAPYSQGLPRVRSVAPEEKPPREKEGSAPAVRKAEPEPPMTHGELLAQFTATGWLERPWTDPLRQIAERTLARSLGQPRGEPATSPAAGLMLSVHTTRRP